MLGVVCALCRRLTSSFLSFVMSSRACIAIMSGSDVLDSSPGDTPVGKRPRERSSDEDERERLRKKRDRIKSRANYAIKTYGKELSEAEAHVDKIRANVIPGMRKNAFIMTPEQVRSTNFSIEEYLRRLRGCRCLDGCSRSSQQKGYQQKVEEKLATITKKFDTATGEWLTHPKTLMIAAMIKQGKSVLVKINECCKELEELKRSDAPTPVAAENLTSSLTEDSMPLLVEGDIAM